MQLAAVMQTEGPVLVLAGAGSGKTRVLTMRTAYLIKEKEVSPYSILAITFTNKAAQEMKERIERLTGEYKGMWISTFHATCAKILRMDIDKLGYNRSFSIYDESDTVSLLKDVLHKLNFDKEYISPKSAKWTISRAKNMDIGPEKFENEFPSRNAEDMVKVYAEYEKQLKQNNALDFDDLMLKTLELFRKNKDVLAYYGKKFRYILVDEYQDTNLVQYELIRNIAGFHGNIFVVGDDDQSIYGWRGADIRNILEFEKDFPGARVIRLERNYRSHQKILDAANSVIEKNTERKGKQLWTDCSEGALPMVFTAQTDKMEAEYIASEIWRLKSEGSSLDDMAVIYRTNSQSRVFEEELKKYALPYKVYGGIGFYERKEIKDIAAYLNLIVNPRADVSLDRIINEPKRGIGGTTLEKIKTEAVLCGISEYEACRESHRFLDARAASNVKKFIDIMEELIAEKDKRGVSSFVDYVLDRSGYMKMLDGEDTPEARARKDNLEEFLNTTAQYETIAEEPTLEGYLERNSLIADIDTLGDEKETLSLITLHSAKGLEFDNVFIAGMQESLMPHAMAEKENGVEEERRLCYVGMTRAKKRLYLTWSKTRMVYVKKQDGGLPYQIIPCERSRFLDEIPFDMLDHVGDKKDKHESFTRKREERKVKPMAFAAFERNIAAPSKNANVRPENFSAGVKVWHDKFGDGVVTQVNGEGTEKIAVVNFDAHGVKKMFVAFAPLTIKE
jgi:DNA helicase-2/ATP-dependent DNA helicase PcrA